MKNNFLQSVKKVLGSKKEEKNDVEKDVRIVSVSSMEHSYKAGDLADAALILRSLLEEYGERKKKNHRTKGREFIYFILSHKHKDLKSAGYSHWQHINKIIGIRHDKVYPYHQQNLRNAMDFFKKEIKGINSLEIEIK